jgi:hypothetical protein
VSPRCTPGGHDVPDHEAEYLGGGEAVSGPGGGPYACHEHGRELGLIPAASGAWTGRRDAPPVPPGRAT